MTTKLYLSQKLRIFSFCDIFKGYLFSADTESSTFSKAWIAQTQQKKKDAHTEKRWKTGIYSGSTDRASNNYNI